MDEVKCTIRECKLPIEILSFSETFLKTEHSDQLISIDGYRLSRKDRDYAGGGGIVVYIKESVDAIRRNDLEYDGVECLWIQVNIPYIKSTLIGRVDWFELFENMVKAAMETNMCVVMIGDFNIDLLKDNHGHLTNITMSYGLEQTVKSATRVTETSSTLIDHVYVSNPDLIIEMNVTIIGISDHFSVTLTLKCKNTGRKGNGHNTIEIRSMDEFNDAEFNHELKIKLELLNQNSNMGVCEQVKNLNMAILSVFNKQVPLKEKRI